MVIQVRALRVVLGIFAVSVSIGCALNVYGDDAAVRSDAEATACPRGCAKASSVQVERSPLAETITYVLPGGTVSVRCARAAVLVGPYSCAKE
jgi:hypothetical protein